MVLLSDKHPIDLTIGQELPPTFHYAWVILSSPPRPSTPRAAAASASDADIMTPYEKLKSLPEAAVYLTPETTFQQLDAVAFALSDNDAARALHEARARLFRSIDPAA